MSILLRIFNQKWKRVGIYIDQVVFPKDFNRRGKVIKRKTFVGYEKMADWLEKNTKYKNKVMLVRAERSLGLSKKVIFDGVGVWLEGYGRI